MIQALSCAQLPALTALEAQVQSGASPHSLKEALADSRTAVLGYYHDEALAGYALVARLPYETEVQAIGVLKAYRGQGLGRALLQAVIDQSLAWQSERVLLEVREHNTSAIELYKWAGFGVDGRRRGYYPAANGAGREDALLMSKAL